MGRTLKSQSEVSSFLHVSVGSTGRVPGGLFGVGGPSALKGMDGRLPADKTGGLWRALPATEMRTHGGVRKDWAGLADLTNKSTGSPIKCVHNNE